MVLGPAWHRVGCQRTTASLTISSPRVLRSAAPIGQNWPIGSNVSGTTKRFAQLVALSGEDCRRPLGWFLYELPSTSDSPRGTMTSQQDRPVTWPDLVSGWPQPSPGASRTVWVSKNTSPVSAGLVPAEGT